MKNFLLLVVLATSLTASAQPSGATAREISRNNTTQEPGFSFFRGHKQGQSGHGLQWSMTSTAGIDHYEIQSTYEDPFDVYSNWTLEGTAAGGRANVIRFLHQNVTPGVISYRIIAVMSNGGPAVVSDIYTVSID